MHTKIENENSVIHLCNDDAVTTKTHHNKKRAHSDEVRHKQKLAEENRAKMRAYIEETNRLTSLHTLTQLKRD